MHFFSLAVAGFISSFEAYVFKEITYISISLESGPHIIPMVTNVNESGDVNKGRFHRIIDNR